MKSPLRWSKASGSTKRRVEKIVAQGSRTVRRQFVAVERGGLRGFLKGGPLEP